MHTSIQMENAHGALKKDHFDFLDHEQAETKLTKDSTEQKMNKNNN